MALWSVRLTGLLLLFGFIALCSVIHVPRIESDLQGKAESALQAEGIEGVAVMVSGRDITLQPNPALTDPDKARNVVAAIPGVRTVFLADETSVSPTLDPALRGGFAFTISHESPAGEVLLSGDLPSLVDQSRLEETLATNGAGVDADGVTQKALTVRGAPEIFFVVAAASRELASGQLSLGPDSISVVGKPISEESAGIIRKKLEPFLGLGYALNLSLNSSVASNPSAQTDPAPINSGTGQPDSVGVNSSEASGTGVSLLSQGLVQQCQQQINEILSNRPIRFANGRVTLRRTSLVILNKLVAAVSACPDVNIAITGYTDSIGKQAANIRLSQQRADAVRDYLVSKGIDASRIKTTGKGAAEPVASNKTAAGRARNRRIELTLEGVE